MVISKKHCTTMFAEDTEKLLMEFKLYLDATSTPIRQRERNDLEAGRNMWSW